VLLFGGCYSNLQATQALLDKASQLGIPPDRIVCTGDVVAYAADPMGTVDLVRASGMHVVMGNCEESLGLNAADCGCGFEVGSACDMLSVAWYAMRTRCWIAILGLGCGSCRAVSILWWVVGAWRLSMAVPAA